MCETHGVRRQPERSAKKHQGKRGLSLNPKPPTQVPPPKKPKLASDGSTPTTNLANSLPSGLLDVTPEHEESQVAAQSTDVFDHGSSSLAIGPTSGTHQGRSLVAAPSSTATNLGKHLLAAPVTTDADLSGHLARIL